VKKERLFCNRLSHMMKHGCTTEPASKHQSRGWKNMPLLSIKKAKSVPSACKVMLIQFWEFMDRSLCATMIVNRWYCDMLEEELKPLYTLNAKEC